MTAGVGNLEPVVLTLGFRADLTSVENNVFALVPIVTTALPVESLSGPASGTSAVPVVESFNTFLVALDALTDASNAGAADTDQVLTLGEELTIGLQAILATGGGEEAEEAAAEGDAVEQRPDLQQFVSGLREGLAELGWVVPTPAAQAPPRTGSFWQTLFQWLGKYVQEWMRQTSAVPMAEGDQAALPPYAFDVIRPTEGNAEEIAVADGEPALPSDDRAAVEVLRPGRWSALFAGALLVAGTFYRRQRSGTPFEKDRQGDVSGTRNGRSRVS